MFGFESLAAEAMDMARGLVLLGSSASVHDRLPWQTTLENWLRPHLEKRIPTIGFCYGHQMLAHMFGGQVGFVAEDQKKLSGLRRIKLHAGSIWHEAEGDVVVSHREMVTVAPKDMLVIAHSPEIDTDGLVHRTLPIFSFQSHPEATQEFMRSHAISAGQEALTFGHGLVDRFVRFAAHLEAETKRGLSLDDP